MKIEMTVAEANDILDDLGQLDGQWSATYRLYLELQAIVTGDQAKTLEELGGQRYDEDARTWPPTDGRWAYLALGSTL